MKLIPFVLLIVLALLLAAPAGAQLPMPDPLASWFTVQVNEVEITNSDPLTLSTTGVQTDNCVFPLLVDVESFDWGLRFSLERDFSAENILCQQEGSTFQVELILPGEMTADDLADGIFVEINNYVGRLTAGPDGDSDVQLEAAQRTFSTVEEMTMTTGGLNVRGIHATGCQAPFITRTGVEADNQTISVDLYRFELLAQQACPAILLMYDTTISLPDDLEGAYTINANNRQLVYDFDEGEMVESDDRSMVMKSYTFIDSVEVLVQESMPMQLQIKVTGNQPDGCQLPVIVEQRRADNAVLVDIYRELPIDMMCTMQLVPYEETISIEGDFEPGTYTISVNGTIVEVEL